ncbi:hypothetical protein HF072_06740 [Bacillus sp. RO3]|nr:hypothetical protein [Bacillus sp. RO3]
MAKNSAVKRVYQALRSSWSIHSSTKWRKDEPAKGQCGVTTLVVHDILGGEIRKRKTWECSDMMTSNEEGVFRCTLQYIVG